MYRIYTSVNFNNEIVKVLPTVQYSVELLIKEDDLKFVSKDLYTILEKDIQADIIISSNTNKKAIRVFNLISRLTDLGARVFWLNDKKIFNLNSHFLIFDKINVINKIFYYSEDNIESQVLYFSNIFNNILSNSEKVQPKIKSIELKLNSNKTIIHRSDIITLGWSVKNADIFQITPSHNLIKNNGSIKVQLQKDTMFKLKAQNKKEQLTKLLFVRVLNQKILNIDVKVYDPIVENYIFLKPIANAKSEKYFCYKNQKVVISWHYEKSVEVFEKRIGKLQKNEVYSFTINETKNFRFEYKLKNKNISNNITIIPRVDKHMSNIIFAKPSFESPIKKINKLISNIILKKK